VRYVTVEAAIGPQFVTIAVFQMYAMPVPKTPRSASAASGIGMRAGCVAMSGPAARKGETTTAAAAAVVSCTVEMVRLSYWYRPTTNRLK
jgi:hypothetical protein